MNISDGFMSDAQTMLTPEEMAELGVRDPSQNVSALRALLNRWREMKARRCETCRWWTADPDPREASAYGDCGAAADSGVLRAVPWEAYGEGDGGLRTAPDFGCVQWEPKA